MGKIKVLPQHEIHKIAAGEVVERPANVVKELLENAIDAGATQITLFIEDGGKKRIRIIDNGCGMSPEDARLCIENHATSKISTVEDLETVTTFGFRGEALASIAAISHMMLTTKEEDALQGISYSIEQGAIIAEEPTTCNRGTQIDIQDIFYNVPARQKFLKKTETEWRAIYTLFQAFCLDNLACTFTLHHDERHILHCPATKTLQERMAQVFDAKLVHEIIDCNADEPKDSITVTGCISRPTYNRYDRNNILFFVNHRWIKNYKLSQALMKGYAGILPAQRYPAACIFISIDSSCVDINIHPRKEEVQFLHPRIVERTIEQAVKTALDTTLMHDIHTNQTNTSLPQHSMAPANSVYAAPRRPFSPGAYASPLSPQTYQNDIPQPHTITPHATGSATETNEINEAHNQSIMDLEQQQHVLPETLDYRLIGQIHTTYIIIETSEGLVIIDQHAAHERVLYELFSERFDNSAITHLMFPQLITLSKNDHDILLPHLELFAQSGVQLEPFSDHQYIVKTLPVFLKNIPIEEVIKAAVGWLHDCDELPTNDLLKELRNKLQAMMACKAAVKAGDSLTEKEMHELIRKLYACPNKTTCPHGRPTWWRISIAELEKNFKRRV